MMSRASAFLSVLLILLSFGAAPLWGQESLPVLTMDQVVEKALASGFDGRILAGNLELSRSQQAQTEARNSFGLSGRMAYTANAGLLGTYKDRNAMLGVPTPEQLLASGSSGSSSGSSSLPSTYSQYVTQQQAAAAAAKASSAAAAAAATALGDKAIPVPQTITASLTAAVPASGTPFTSIGVSATQRLQLTGYTDNSPVDTTTNSTTLAVTLAQTVWDGVPGGQPKAAIDKSRLSLQVQELAARNNQLALVLRIRQAFLAMLVAQKNLDVLANIANRQASLLKQAQIKFTLQQATRLDLLNAQVSARNAELDLQSGRNTFTSTRANLSLLMGMDAGSEYRIAEPPPRPLPSSSLDEAIALALAQRTDLQQLNLNSRVSTIDQTLGMAAAHPVVSVNGGVNFQFNWTTLGKEDQRQTGTFYAGLSLGMPILDSGAAAAQTAIATRQLAIYQQQREQLTRSIGIQVETAWNNCQVLQGRVETTRQSVEALTLQHLIVQNQQEAGTATRKDELNALANLGSAELAHLQAQFNLQTAVLNLENTMGQ